MRNVRLSPTALNLQPYLIYAVQSEKGIEKVRRAKAPDYGESTIFVVCSDRTKSWNNRYSEQENILQDVGIVAATIVYACQDIGLSSCYVCNFDPSILKTELELSKNIIPECLIYAGYPSAQACPSPRHTQRRDLKEFLSFI